MHVHNTFTFYKMGVPMVCPSPSPPRKIKKAAWNQFLMDFFIFILELKSHTSIKCMCTTHSPSTKWVCPWCAPVPLFFGSNRMFGINSCLKLLNSNIFKLQTFKSHHITSTYVQILPDSANCRTLTDLIATKGLCFPHNTTDTLKAHSFCHFGGFLVKMPRVAFPRI